MAIQWISWESPDDLRIAFLNWEEKSQQEEEIWEELENTPNDFIGFLSSEMEKESESFWEREYQRHMAAEAEIAALLSEMEVETVNDGWDGLVNLGRGIRG